MPLRVEAGRSFRVVDVEGGQVADLFAFCLDDLGEHLSAEHTRADLFRLFPRVGESFVTNRRRPILLFEADTSPGHHDMLFAACDAARYASLGAAADHASCAAQPPDGAGRARPRPRGRAPARQPVREHPRAAGRHARLAGDRELRPGDHVQLRAERDCVVVVSACPYDLGSISPAVPGPARHRSALARASGL